MTLAVRPVIQRRKWKDFYFFRSSYYSLVLAPPADLLALQMNLTYIWLGNSQIVKIIKCSMKGPASAGNLQEIFFYCLEFFVNVDFTEHK